jgi:Centrosomin N-terminal motif 1
MEGHVRGHRQNKEGTKPTPVSSAPQGPTRLATTSQGLASRPTPTSRPAPRPTPTPGSRSTPTLGSGSSQVPVPTPTPTPTPGSRQAPQELATSEAALLEFMLQPPAELMERTDLNTDDPMQKSLNLKELEAVCIQPFTTFITNFMILQAMDNLKKENFSLKLRIFYLQEHLAKMRPENLEGVLNEVCS